MNAEYAVRWRRASARRPANALASLLAVEPTPDRAGLRLEQRGGDTGAVTPNLLNETNALITVEEKDGSAHHLNNPVDALRDGKPEAPPKPWLGGPHQLYRLRLARPAGLQIDTFRTQVKLTGITFVEDPAHPESWLRDMRLQYWDAVKEQWLDGPYLLSDAAAHTHWFDAPNRSGEIPPGVQPAAAVGRWEICAWASWCCMAKCWAPPTRMCRKTAAGRAL